jgi:hypothetical protein
VRAVRRIRRLARTGRLTRFARRQWLGRSPLHRRTDRIEAWIMAGLLAVFLAGAPLSWVEAGRWVQHGGQREQRAQQSWHQIPAILVQTAPAVPRYYFRTALNPDVQVMARWMLPGGRARVGEISVPAGSWTGRRVQVWVDGSGRPTGPPLLPSVLAKRVASAEVLAPLLLAALVVGLARLLRWMMDRRRLAGWEADWAFTGPRWTKHR